MADNESNQGANNNEGAEGNQGGIEGAQAATQQQEPPKPKEKEQSPPWGSDEEFDPEKAWKLIQNLRSEKEQLKPLADKAKELEDAQKTEVERASEAKQTAEQQAAEARSEATRLRMAIKYGLEEDDLDLLGSGSEEDIEARAKRLSERIGNKGAEDGNEENGGTTTEKPTKRPSESLKPGAAPPQELAEVRPGMGRLRAAYEQSTK